jgi:hypothetical protein
MDKNSKMQSMFRKFHPELVHKATFHGLYEFPMLDRTNYIPEQLVSFEKRQNPNKHQCLHFYTYDDRFECVWDKPEKYLKSIQEFGAVIAPDFSIFRDFPLVFQIYNVYRSRALAYWWQSNGLNVIPNIRWGDERTYEFIFDGIEKEGTVAIGSLGGIKNTLNKEFFFNGFKEMLKRIQPRVVVIYGAAPEQLYLWCEKIGTKIAQFNFPFDVSHENSS